MWVDETRQPCFEFLKPAGFYAMLNNVRYVCL